MILSALYFSLGFSVVIGLVIIFMDRVVNNYGECKIIINNDKEFHAQGGQTLLRMLFENKYFIPSACGGKGTCGYCKLKIHDGAGPILPTESLILTPKERAENFRMACQVKVKGDMAIEIPPEYLEIQEYEGEISLTEDLTSDIKRIQIKLLSPDKIKYKPGQYVQILVPTEEGSDFRAYSMASSPVVKDMVELNIKRIPEGIGSGYMHARKLGDNVELSGPYGDFYLREDSHRDIICVAGGVGLAPLKSIVLYWDSHNINRDIFLFYGSRTLADLYDHDYFMELASRKEKFHYHPALSDDEPGWTGDRGFIHTLIPKYIRSGEHSEAYLCGPPIMIDAVTATLVGEGVHKERIWYDKF